MRHCSQRDRDTFGRAAELIAELIDVEHAQRRVTRILVL